MVIKSGQKGFTIVELLIVVVVIGILAAIVTVAYTGITQRANNAKTLAAVNSWAAAIQLYVADNGSYPTSNSCLGSTTTYTDVGYGNFCWDVTYWDVKTSFLNQMAPYIGNTYPEPDITHIGGGATNRRGAFYHIVSSTDHEIRAMFSGVSTCPASSAGPLDSVTPMYTYSDGLACRYQLD